MVFSIISAFLAVVDADASVAVLEDFTGRVEFVDGFAHEGGGDDFEIAVAAVGV